MEALHNKNHEFNNIKFKPMIEYYDYTKSKNSLINDLNNPNSRPKKTINNSYPSKYQGQGRKNYNNNSYNKFTNQGHYNIQKFDNVIC